jgi:hypothetical protein
MFNYHPEQYEEYPGFSVAQGDFRTKGLQQA